MVLHGGGGGCGSGPFGAASASATRPEVGARHQRLGAQEVGGTGHGLKCRGCLKSKSRKRTAVQKPWLFTGGIESFQGS